MGVVHDPLALKLVRKGTKVSLMHTGRNCFDLFQISFSATTADTDPGMSKVSKDQKFYEKFKNAHCQVDHSAKME